MKMEILELLIRLAVLVMAGIVIPAFRRWLNARTDNERLNKIRSWVYDADGSKRKKYVHNAVMKICLNNKILITDRELDILIEAAVNTINSIHAANTEGGPEDVGSEEDT